MLVCLLVCDGRGLNNACMSHPRSPARPVHKDLENIHSREVVARKGQTKSSK